MPKQSQKRVYANALAEFAVIGPEDLELLEELRAGHISAYRPVTSRELYAVENLAIASFYERRCLLLEDGLVSVALTDGERLTGLTDTLPVRSGDPLSIRLQEIAGSAGAWRFLLRCSDETDKLHQYAVRDFERLKALRPKIPNEPIQASEFTQYEPCYQLEIEACYRHALKLRPKIPNEPIPTSRSTRHERHYPQENKAPYRQRMKLPTKAPNEPIPTRQFTEHELAMRDVARPNPKLDRILRKPRLVS